MCLCQSLEFALFKNINRNSNLFDIILPTCFLCEIGVNKTYKITADLDFSSVRRWIVITYLIHPAKSFVPFFFQGSS